MTASATVVGTVDDALAIMNRLRSRVQAGATMNAKWRQDQLKALDRFMSEQSDAIAAAMAEDLGKSAFEAAMFEIAPTRMELNFAKRNFRRWMRPVRVRVPLFQRPGRAWHVCEPLGVVLIIGPWNYPFYLLAAPLVGALAAGNAVVLKPSEHAPATTRLLAEQLPRYLDSQAVAVVEGEAETTQRLIEGRPDFVFFTGGERAGRAIGETAARHLVPVALELGGKSPTVVAADADIEVAARRIAFGKVSNAGQTCVAPDYVLVEDVVADKLIAALTEALRQFTRERPASGLRVLNSAHVRRLKGMIDSAGGRVVLGGGVDEGAAHVQPTIVVDPDLDAALMREEIFGPILPVIRVNSVREAIAFIRARPHPLAAYIFTDDQQLQRRFTEAVHAGGIAINHVTLQVGVPQLPFGGVGSSGLGRYHGWWSFETFSHRKAVLSKPFRPDITAIYPPYGRVRRWLISRFMR